MTRQGEGVQHEIEQLSANFADAPSIFTTSPLYRAFAAAAAEDEFVLELLVERRAGQQPSFLLFGAMHYLLLAGADHPIRTFYPSLVGTSAANAADATPHFRNFCRDYHDDLIAIIRTRLVQTNVVKRVSALRYALWAIGRTCSQPVHLVEVGASAGIHLLFDRYAYELGGHHFGEKQAALRVKTEWRSDEAPPDLDDIPRIATRIGVDLNPVDAHMPEERLWLRALVWPEDREKADLLSLALETVAADPPTILAGDAIDVCPTIGTQLPPGEPRVVFHAATRMHVPLERRAAFDDAIDAIGAGGPMYHVWQEPSSAPHRGSIADARGTIEMHGPADDKPVPLALVDGHLEWMAALDASR